MACGWCEERIEWTPALDVDLKEYHSECRDEMVFLRLWKEAVQI